MVLLALLSSILLILGRLIGGNNGIIVALVFSTFMSFISYYFSDKIVLSMYQARPLDKSKYKYIYDMVEELCATAKLPMPRLWYLPTPIANAFATGRNPSHASVGITQGILSILEPHELRGVLAHEISHIKNRDILVGTVAATIAMAIGYVADMMRYALYFGGNNRDNNKQGMGILGTMIIAVFMPFIAMLIQLAITRSREFLADECGAHYSYDPLALASALEKLHGENVHLNKEAASQAQAATASLFIVYPFSGKKFSSLFSTHPPVEERVRRLRKMAFNV